MHRIILHQRDICPCRAQRQIMPIFSRPPTARTTLQRPPARQLAHALEQPRRDLLAARAHARGDALGDGALDGRLDRSARGVVREGDGHGEERREGPGEGE